MDRVKDREILEKGISERWRGLGKGMVVGSLCRKLGKRDLSNSNLSNLGKYRYS